jgi:hypothetical protein
MPIRPARIGPRVVSRRPSHSPRPRHRGGPAAAALERGAAHRIADLRIRVQDRAEGLHLGGRQVLAVDAVEPERVDAALRLADVDLIVAEVEHAALREHDVVVELLAEPFPELQRVLVECRTLVPEIVGADDRRVAAGVAKPDRALLEHGDIRDPVLLGQIVGGGEAVATAADHDDVIGGLGLGLAPGRPPRLVVTERVPEETSGARIPSGGRRG